MRIWNPACAYTLRCAYESRGVNIFFVCTHNVVDIIGCIIWDKVCPVSPNDIHIFSQSPLDILPSMAYGVVRHDKKLKYVRSCQQMLRGVGRQSHFGVVKLTLTYIYNPPGTYF